MNDSERHETLRYERLIPEVCACRGVDVALACRASDGATPPLKVQWERRGAGQAANR